MKKLLALLLFPLMAHSAKDRVLKFEAIARNEQGVHIYTERHEHIYRAGKLHTSRTFYIKLPDKHFATEKNSFKGEDYAFPISKIYYPKEPGVYEGSKIENGKYVIYRNSVGSDHEEETYEQDGLVIAGQGIHFYLLHHLEKVKAEKQVEFKFLIPARLDYYTFEYKFIKEENGKYHFRIEVASWLFKLLAPSFDAVYDKRLKRIVSYKGLSNWKDDKGELQKVEIEYIYSDK